ncbi:MAG: hypothetical protein GXP17_09560 [Gammaproteobacteria bacterium]|nr:hypothetical protein [Gammaproteobacteria bacterium]
MCTKKTPANFGQAQRLLEQLRLDFLEELPERLNIIEADVLRLGKPASSDGAFEECFRQVHSLKGSAGTHGIPFISRICHHLENGLSQLKSDANPAWVDMFLRHVDLMRRAGDQACHQSHQEQVDFHTLEGELEQLQRQRCCGKKTALIVEDSSLMSGLYQACLAELPVALHMETDGLEALTHLLREKYDFVIMGAQTRPLNGTALLYALRASGGCNDGIPVLMVTSASKPRFVAGMAPDFLLRKNRDLSERLQNVVRDIVQPPPVDTAP